MKIAIADDYQSATRTLACFSKLDGHAVTVYTGTLKNANDLPADIGDVEGLVLIQQRVPFTQAHLDRMPALKVIAQTGKNVAHIDLDACTRRGVAVVAAGTGSPFAPAELTWGLILASLRSIPQEVAALRAGQWQSTLGVGLHGKTLGIYAYGKIGSLVAKVGSAFGMKVICWGRGASLEKAKADGFEAAASREALFEQSDVLTLHIPLNRETRGLVTADDLARMKPTALFVNTSRAPLVAAGALEQSLKAGRPGFAAVDVFEDEPVYGAAHPLLKMDNVIATPHLGYVERNTYEMYFGAAFDNLAAFATGKPQNVLNPEALAPK
ncbi:MAG: D-2-hydroxyacid dehydrogenase family protein [Proteobacteria bacterium]|nr:D-2-hydroxyacid dehydrogenase family protein [Burkholderiales bacterium]